MINKKIVHLADYQIEVRNSGNGNRYDEYREGLSDALVSIINDQPDMIVITGDIYEFSNTTSAERGLQTWFLRELSKISTVVITNGNHDLKQKNNELIIDHKSAVEPDDIQTVLEALDNPNIKYLKRTGFYEVDGVTFAVWGHYEKFNRLASDQRPYSPWELDESKDYNPNNVIELFHDPVQNCKGFSGKSEIAFLDYKRKVTDFKSPLVLAGDIHMPDIIEFGNDQTFTYCSSLIMRNFGEGNYYKNGHSVQKGNNNHGYNLVHYTNDGENVTKSIEFKSIKPKVSRHTITLDDKFDYDNIEMVAIDKTEFNHIRFKIDDKVDEFFKNQDKLYAFLQSVCNCTFHDPVFDKNVGVDFNDEYTIDSVESIINSDKVVELAEVYIGKAVDKTTTIGKEDAEKAKKMLNDIFKKAFNKAGDLTTNIKTVTVEKLTINNALTFGQNVVVDIDSIGNIVRVSGANAVGKTKIFTILGYMFTDLLHADQKPNQHKNNRLELFNYTQPTDVVQVEMDFSINGKKHHLIKTVKRSWKKGDNKWQDKDWKNFISGTPSLDIKLTKDDGVEITDYESVMLFMRDLISFDDFYRHLFVNQRTLENLLKMKTDNLIAEILEIIGLNFFESLNDDYDEEKDRILNQLTKPSGTIESLLSEIGIKEGLIENAKNRKEEIQIDITNTNIDISNKNSQIDVLNKSLGNVKKTEDVEVEIELNNTNITTTKNSIDVCKKLIEDEKEIIKSIDLTSISNQINEKRTSKDNNTLEKSKYETEISNLQTGVTNSKTEIDTYKSKKENEKSTLKNNINSVISENKSSINKLNTRLVEIKNVIAQKLKEKTDANNIIIREKQNLYEVLRSHFVEAETELQKLKNVHSSLSNDISNLKSTKDTYLNSDKCKSCGEFVGENIQEKIDSVEKSISEKEDKEKQLSELVAEKSKNLELVLRKKMRDAHSELENVKSVEISHTISDEPILKEEVLEISKKLKDFKTSNEQKEKEILDIKSNFEYLKDEYITIRQEKIDNVEKDKQDLLKKIEVLNDINIGIEVEIKSLEDKKTERAKMEISVAVQNGKLNSLNKDLELYITVFNNLEKDLELSKSMSKVFDEIATIKAQKERSEDTIKNLEVENIGLNSAIKDCERTILENKESIIALKEYTLTTAVVKQYKVMLGKNGLQKYIFGKIVDILNGQLSVLLEDVSMRLFFDKDNLDLRKHDLRSNILSGVQMASGMESSILGLSLLKALKSLNQVRKFNILMVDEISGQFNDGEGLSYNAYNYQGLFINLLGKIKDDTCVYVVDHHIKDLGESSVLEVQLTDSGSIINRR